MCKDTRKVTKQTCDPSEPQLTTLKNVGRQWVRQASHRDIKRELLKSLSESYQIDAEMISALGGQSAWRRPAIQDGLSAAQKACAGAAQDGSLRDALNASITAAQGESIYRAHFSSMPDSERQNLLDRFVLARIELQRLDRLINDNFVRGPERSRALSRRAAIQAAYPLAQDLQGPSLERRLAVREGLMQPFRTVIAREEEVLIDQVLKINQGASTNSRLPQNAERSLLGALAERLHRGERLSRELRQDAVTDFERALARRLRALGELCEAPRCQAYELSLEITASLVNGAEGLAREDVLSDICHCQLSSASQPIANALLVGSTAVSIGGFVACVATNVACPVLATIGLVSTAIGGVSTWGALRDSVRSQGALDLSRGLPDQSPQDRNRIQNFAARSQFTALGLVAASAGGVATTNFRQALSPIDATKEVLRSNAQIKAAGAWQTEFLSRYPQYRDLPEAEIKRIAKEVSEKGEGFVREVLRVKDVSLRQYVNQDGETVLKYATPSGFSSRAGNLTERTLAVDAKTGAIDANFDGGAKLVRSIVEGSDTGVVVIFKDLNHLGKTNYFHHGQAAGDQYLQGFGNAIRANLRPGDIMFKTGGDEIVTVIPITDPKYLQPENVKAITQRMVDSVHFSKEARQVFSEQSRILAQEYRAVRSAKSIDEIPSEIQKRFSSDEMASASRDFPSFQKEFLENQTKLLQLHSQYRPSISIGAVIVKPGASFEEAKRVAEAQAQLVKIDYKMRTGANPEELSKYGVSRPASSSPPALRRRGGDTIKPEPGDPLILDPQMPSLGP